MNLSLIGSSILGINILLILFLVFHERRNPSATWAWVLILTVFPIIGFLIYLFLGRNLSGEKIFNEKIIRDEKRNVHKHKLTNNYEYHLEALENKDLIRMHYKNAHSFYTQMNNVKLYFHGKEKFDDLFKEINNAKNFIHLEYYIIQCDNLGKQLIKLLTKKAKEGLEVKLLFDAMGSYKLSKQENKLLKPFSTAGGKFAAFFPTSFPLINRRINFRNHRKIVVIDGIVGFLGGFNVGKEYIGENKKIGNWRDTHIKVKGEAVHDLEVRFLLDWCYASKEDISNYNKYFPNKKILDKKVGMQIVSSGPDHKEQYIKNGYVKIINNAKNLLYIQTPYFVPDENLLESLKIAAFSGVDVRVMIPGKPDHKFMFWAAQSYISELLKSGVRVFFYNKGFLHCKTIVADNSVCSIGTANMDIRSFKLNFETNAFIYNQRINASLKKQFILDMKNSKEITLDEFNKRSGILKILESITRLLSPIL